jgi:hypothetical protein
MTDPKNTDSHLFVVIVENPPEGAYGTIPVGPGDEPTIFEPPFAELEGAKTCARSLHDWDTQRKLGRLRVYDYSTEAVVFELKR